MVCPIDPSELWEDYKERPSVKHRNRLVEHYHPTLVFIAKRVASKLPAKVELGDLHGWGALGLIEAVNRFDLDKGIKFTTYASSRIRGAIFDGIRNYDWVSRDVRQRHKAWKAARLELLNDTDNPTEKEIAQKTGNPLIERKEDVQPIRTDSLFTKYYPSNGVDRELFLIDLIENNRNEHPDERAIAKDIFKRLISSNNSLGREEKLIISLYYYEGLTMKEIGRTIGYCESRVSQLHSQLMKRLKAKKGLKELLTA